MRFRVSILLSMGLAALAFTTACTWKDAYDAVQGSHQDQCRFLPDVQQRQRCLQTTSYDTYERERQKMRP
ncbi:hypothetical protein CAL26_16215 [Bordetella genomosp. 9]|uniref:Lipoprotein n=1 Tax=Bordetella genomosp. 9 TaxID=1416803 RepID=A0A261R4E6_9BORD|nr:hypothetical protein [Bordetella genomosp. 9]OZI19193.1 hypothetical protein CAL26_16215 [Bordetella genomosp. 9]